MIGERLLKDVVKRHRLRVRLIGFDVNEWGSAQYGGALDAFNVLDALSKKLHDKRAVMKELGITARHSGVRRDPADALKQWKAETKHQASAKKINWGNDLNQAIRRGGPDTYDEVLVSLRKAAWDLWTAAPFVASLAFKQLRVSARTAPGVGPLANMMAQGENYRTGVCCWLLAQSRLAQKSSFADFDT